MRMLQLVLSRSAGEGLPGNSVRLVALTSALSLFPSFMLRQGNGDGGSVGGLRTGMRSGGKGGGAVERRNFERLCIRTHRQQAGRKGKEKYVAHAAIFWSSLEYVIKTVQTFPHAARANVYLIRLSLRQ